MIKEKHVLGTHCNIPAPVNVDFTSSEAQDISMVMLRIGQFD